MSGGFETIISSAIAGIAYLASPEGQLVQKRAYEDIIASYGSGAAAFEHCISEEKSRYTAAFVRETLRYYPPLHLLPPRQTYKDFKWKNQVTVPKGVMVLVNAQAANSDPATYGPDAHIFRPERWLEGDELTKKIPPPYHFSFGTGSRGCTAINFSNRLLYAIFLRLIVSFEIHQSDLEPPNTDRINYNPNTAAQTAIPKDFKAYFGVRDKGVLSACLERCEDGKLRI